MTETRDMMLGGKTFAVPQLPFGVNMKAYPLLRRLHNNGFVDRWFSADGVTTEDDMIDIADVLFMCACVAEPEFTRADFEALPITPAELLDSFMVARFQSGGWVPTAGDDEPGEAQGAETSPTSTSTESSQN